MIKPYKKDCGYTYTAGFFPTIALLQNQRERCQIIYVHPKALKTDGYKKVLALCAKEIPCEVSAKMLTRLGAKENDHVIGVFKTVAEKLDDKADHIVLVNPQDMGNIGNIMRTMLAFDYKDLALITPCADWLNPKAIRASMGAFFSLKIQTFSSFAAYLKEYPRPYYPFILQTPRTLSRIETIPLGTMALVFGNEAAGLPAEFRSAKEAIKIEESAKVDSLNLTTAVAIALHDFRYRIKKS